MNFKDLKADHKFGLSECKITTELHFTDHDVVLLTVKVFNLDYELVYEDTKETYSLQDCISQTVKSILEQYIWDNE